jgi:hypothetical protein
MRKSRVLLAGVAVAAAGVATSAFTGSNTFASGVQNTVVGYGEATATGAHITGIHYNRDATDKNLLTNVVWDTDTDLTPLVTTDDATMTLKDSSGPTLVGTYGCDVAVAGATWTITCTVTGGVTFEDFDTAGLAVGGA